MLTPPPIPRPIARRVLHRHRKRYSIKAPGGFPGLFCFRPSLPARTVLSNMVMACIDLGISTNLPRLRAHGIAK